MKVKSGKTYIGVVEDNNDPSKQGRCKIRVFGIFDDVDLENIPWAYPWKDLAGNGFALPEKGKVVTVVFENADINSPEFISSDHFNINLEKKLSTLNDTDYLSMKSLMFDHKTQVYVNEGEGLKLDHKFNLINIKDTSINVNLKDNFGKINLGTANSTQRAILGDNFLNWFDDFVGILMGSKGGPFLGNLGAPVVATPALLGSLQLYQQLKDPKFLSKNVYIVDNENVAKLDRIAEGQVGDSWQSTEKENNVTSKEPVPYKPTPGPTNTTFEQPKDDTPLSPTQSSPPKAEEPKPKPPEHPDIKIVREVYNIKSYKLTEEVDRVNILAVRNQCILPGDKYTDQFSDKLYVLYKKEDGTSDLKQYIFSTTPGLEFNITDSWLIEKNFTNVEPWIGSTGKKIFMKEYVRIAGQVNGDPVLKDGLPILAPSQYVDTFYISTYKGEKAMRVIPGASQLIWRDVDTTNIDTFNPTNLTTPELIKPNDLIDNGIKIHRGYPGGINVGNWSEGAQVFASSENLNDFFGLCEKHKEKYDNAFTYTLVTKTDWDEATKNVGADKTSDPLGPTASTESENTGTQINSNTAAATQSQTEILVEKNKSEVIDVLGDGTLIVDVFVSDVIKTGKITFDDIKRLEEESMVFTIKHEAIPGQWEFYIDSVGFERPGSSGYGQRATSLKPDKVIYDIGSELYLYENLADKDFDYLDGRYMVEIRLTMNNKNVDFGSENKQKSFTKEVEFQVEKGSASSTTGNTTSGTNADGGNTQTTSGGKEYTIAILNANGIQAKQITGKIIIEKTGPNSQATGTISGFPDGNTLGPFTTTPLLAEDKVLVDEMLIILENQIIDSYQVSVKLVVVEKS